MISQVDILETEIVENYPDVLEILLKDRTSGKNIIWATKNYEFLDERYSEKKSIKLKDIIDINDNVIKPRVQKDELQKLFRVKNMAEVFTPSWVCNLQNNLIDNAWFGRKNVFNKEIPDKKKWKTVEKKIVFPKDKTWVDYVMDKRMEISCGEAPYITSRYDATTGEFIEVRDRIGLLDRKLRVINENATSMSQWMEYVIKAYKNIYSYEWQGDNLLLAREALLFTFIENFKLKFKEEPDLSSIQEIAEIISWNVWQMDGLKGVIPLSCNTEKRRIIDLFGEEKIEDSECPGCKNNEIHKHNGKHCIIMDWFGNKDTVRKEKKVRFIDLIKK